MPNIQTRTWIARLLIGIVIAWNLQAAFSFIFFPSRFVQAYELSGTSGEAAIRGFGVLFLMWNVPYLFALIDPVRYRLALTLSLLMQLTGLIGNPSSTLLFLRDTLCSEVPFSALLFLMERD